MAIQGVLMINATGCFTEAIDKWVRAMRSDDFTSARIHAEHLHKHGELLVIQPEFRKCISKHCPDLDAEQELSHLGQFLSCVAACRGQAAGN